MRKHKAKGVECGIGNAECGNIGQRELNSECERFTETKVERFGASTPHAGFNVPG